MVATGPRFGRKIDCTEGSIIPAHVNHLWPLVTDVERWPAWLRDGRGQGLAEVRRVADTPGRIDPKAPTGGRYAMAFTNGLAGEWEVNYWVEPAQISLRLVPESRRDAHGVLHWIFDCDLFPQPDGGTKLWFGATILLEPKFKPRFWARWPARDVQGWVRGFHQRVAAEAARLRLPREAKRQVPAPAAP